MSHIAIIGNQAFSLLNFRGSLIADLVSQGHQVTAIAPDMNGDVAEDLRVLGAVPVEIHLDRVGTNPVQDLLFTFALTKVLNDVRPDVTLGYAVKPVVFGTIAAWLARVPSRYAMVEGLGYVFVEGVNDSLFKKALRNVVKCLYWFALRRAKRVMFLNQEDIDDFVSMNLLERGKAVMIGGIGVDLDQWHALPPVTSPVTFTFVGRLLRDKGVLEFVSAARIIKETYPDVRFLLIGGADENPESVSEEDVRGWVVEGVVEWPGHVPVRPWLKQTSVFVLPSYYREGVPRSTQEAMAMGRPVITTDSVGCRETVVDELNGFLVPPREAKALASAMMRFVSDPNLIATMGVESRALAEVRFDAHKVNKVIIKEMGLQKIATNAPSD